MSQQQRDALDQLLRGAPLDLGGEVAEQPVIFEEMMAAIPVPGELSFALCAGRSPRAAARNDQPARPVRC